MVEVTGEGWGVTLARRRKVIWKMTLMATIPASRMTRRDKEEMEAVAVEVEEVAAVEVEEVAVEVQEVAVDVVAKATGHSSA